MFARSVLVASFFCLPALAQELVNPSFELGDFTNNHPGDNTTTLAPGSTGITGWTVVTGEIAWIQAGNPFSLSASNGDRFLDLTSYSENFGGIQQTLATIPGLLYHVEFDLGSRSAYGNAYMSVRAVDVQGEAAAQQYTRLGTDPSGWDRFTFEFVAREASTDLRFIHDFNGNNYTGLDNVSLRAIPTPGALGLLAIAGLGARRRRQA